MILAPLVLILPIVALFVVSAIRLAYFGHKLSKLLMEKHTEEWKILTTIPGLGPGFSNPFRSLPFMFNKEDYGDKEVLICKIKFRNAFICGVIGVPALFFALFMLLWCIDKLT
jgi:hypothetical protein